MYYLTSFFSGSQSTGPAVQSKNGEKKRSSENSFVDLELSKVVEEEGHIKFLPSPANPDTVNPTP
jgi:hypothetical protein